MRYTNVLAMLQKLVFYSFLLVTLLACSETVEQKPNIIFIMSDDHAHTAVGAYGTRLSSVNPTPHLDELARQGGLFTNVFCTNSICTPSRASIMTGQYSQTNGVLDLDGRLPAAKQYLPKEMSKLGYETAMIGKWHLKEEPSTYDYYEVLISQGKYFDPEFIVREEGDTTISHSFEGKSRAVNVKRTKGHSSDVITDSSIAWLESKRNKEVPFFLMHHYKAPHDDFEYAPRYEDYLADDFIPEPTSLYEQKDFGSEGTLGRDGELRNFIGTSVSQRHPHRSYVAQYGFENKENQRIATSQAYQEYVKRYLRCVKGVDDNLGRLFAYLKDNGLWENTIIIYTGDQGMMLGEHDYMDKRWMYDESMRMPFVVFDGRSQALKGKKPDILVNNTDFAPSIIELAGGEVPEYMQGRSFASVVEGGEMEEERDYTYYRYWMHLVHHDVPAHFGIRSKDHKLIYYYGEHYDTEKYGTKTMWWAEEGSHKIVSTPKAWEFYDLTKDPSEVKNEIDNPDYALKIADMKKELKNLRVEIGETDENFPHLQEYTDAVLK